MDLSGIRADAVTVRCLGLVQMELERFRASLGPDLDPTSSGLLEVGPSVIAALTKLSLEGGQDPEILGHGMRFLGTLVTLNGLLDAKAETVEEYRRRAVGAAPTAGPTSD